MKKLVHVVAAVIKNENGEILCALRGPEMELPNYWEFPGGKIEKGESKVEALEREILEELGCQIEVFEGVDDTTYEYQKVIVRLETFKAKIVKGIPRASEHAELKWVPTIRLPELHWAPADIPTVRRLVNNA
ncbi:(deoxy)nucleoside triphosphate pyrophosphohydrolase [Sporosarcina ureilytica]|uniref:(deoxy)nucleoside triphosphate pyrophosphohydrolase n=1 Tax=Sporosarcina ureilytica TaxID=298596 RepID=UPI00094D5A42|nr:(deoxy)nucleoside triphosphate pyrophosphohydrolase [Sporosarcina ureilytica]